MWLELQELYAQIDGHRIYQISNDIVQLKQVDCTIEIYYHKLKGLWDEINALEAPYVCVCVCNCENGKENGERYQRKRLIQLLTGLDESYSNIRGQMLLMQPLPTVVKAYNMIRHEEKQREGILPKPSNSAAFSTFSSGQRGYNQGNRNNRSKFYQGESSRSHYSSAETTERRSSFKKGVICGNCGKEGHNKEQCYKLVGYPVGHPLHGKYQPPSRSQRQSQEYRPNRTVNMVSSQDDTSTQTKQPQSTQPNTPSEAHFTARIDLLQNQLNQVLMMM